MLERFQRAYGLVHQLLQEAVKGNDKTEDKMSAQKQLKYSTISIKGTMDTLAEPGGSDTDLFDSVTQLDDETGKTNPLTGCFTSDASIRICVMRKRA